MGYRKTCGPRKMSFEHSVQVDHRERQSGLTAHLLNDPIWSVAFEHLQVGDYLIDQRWLIERKSLLDLAESIKDGRLFRQTILLAAAVRRQSPSWRSQTTRNARSSSMGDANSAAGQDCAIAEAATDAIITQACGRQACLAAAAALLVEGHASDLRNSRMNATSIRAALATVSVFVGIPVLRTTCAAESAELLKSIARQGRANAYAGLPRMGARPKGKRKLQLHLLQGLPGIGPERAARLLDHFGDVRSVANACEQELRSVDGIGPSCARRIIWSLGEETPAYAFKSQ